MKRTPKIHPPRYLRAWCPHAKVTLEYVVSGAHKISALLCPKCGGVHALLGSGTVALKGAVSARASLTVTPGEGRK